MRRIGNLWPQIVAYENLYEAARAAAKGKKKRRDVAKFLMNRNFLPLPQCLSGERNPSSALHLFAVAPFSDFGPGHISRSPFGRD